MNLEQVKEHFKYAKEVRSLVSGKVYNLQDMCSNGIHSFNNYFWFNDLKAKNSCALYSPDTNQLAEILTYIFERGEEVEVRNSETSRWMVRRFISFNLDGDPIVEGELIKQAGFNFIRKLTPESLLEPQLSELKKVAEANGMSVEIIFKQK